MRKVMVQEALGMVLCHDVTRIIPGHSKGPAFRKGHIVTPEDIPQLLDMGKEHLYVWEMDNRMLHESDAANRIAHAAGGQGIRLSLPCEGKVELIAEYDGLLKINTDALFEINFDEEIVFATIHSNQEVPAGKIVAGTRVIPLVIDAEKIARSVEICRRSSPVTEIKRLRSLDAGIITTGSEVYHGRIKDQFGPVVIRKLEKFGCRVLGQSFVSDQVDMIVEAIRAFLADGAEMITITGGMSVDPDDVTPAGIKAAGGKVVTYGAPVLPGAMFMLAYIDDVPVLGLPGCVMYHQTSIFDLVLPRILADEKLTRKDLVRLAHGGLCIHCETCRFPDCSFGKGA